MKTTFTVFFGMISIYTTTLLLNNIPDSLFTLTVTALVCLLGFGFCGGLVFGQIDDE